MSAILIATVAERFARIEAIGTQPRSQHERSDRLIADHEVVARQHAEAFFELLTTEPDFRDMSDEEIGARLHASVDLLFSGAAEVRRRRDLDDALTRLCGEVRLTHGFYKKLEEVADDFQDGRP